MTSSSKLSRRFGPWAVVTGASDGIGRAAAVYLAERGLSLVVVARNVAALEELKRTLESDFGVKVRILSRDLSVPGAGLQVVEGTEDLDVGLLVAAAGFGTSGAFVDASLQRERKMLQVNCGAVLEQSYGFARRFERKGRGAIVLLSSIVGFQGVPRAAHYAATKAWIQSFGEGLQVELRPKGVDVLVSAPGPVDSGFADRADMKLGKALSSTAAASETLRALERGRWQVRPGLFTKFLFFSLSFLPRSFRVRALQQVMAGMTKHQVGLPRTQA